ncbi:hypothetical protein EDD22DRAFT_879731 [Suillus occidentalis]|nr:hypothetical protein EDD22DRAFT_879731 [Suillus occidentalis]
MAIAVAGYSLCGPQLVTCLWTLFVDSDHSCGHKYLTCLHMLSYSSSFLTINIIASRSKPSNVRPAPIRGPPLKRKKKFLSDDEEEVAASRKLPTIFVHRPGSAHLPPPPKPIVSGPIEGCHGGIKVKLRGYTFLTVPPCPPAPPAEANTDEEQHGLPCEKRGVRRLDTD